MLEGFLAAETDEKPNGPEGPPRLALLTRAVGPHLGKKSRKERGLIFLVSSILPPHGDFLSASLIHLAPYTWLSPRHEAVEASLVRRRDLICQHAVFAPASWPPVLGLKEDKGPALRAPQPAGPCPVLSLSPLPCSHPYCPQRSTSALLGPLGTSDHKPFYSTT